MDEQALLRELGEEMQAKKAKEAAEGETSAQQIGENEEAEDGTTDPAILATNPLATEGAAPAGEDKGDFWAEQSNTPQGSNRYSEFGIEKDDPDLIYAKMKEFKDKLHSMENSGDYIGNASELTKRAVSLLEGGSKEDIIPLMTILTSDYTTRPPEDLVRAMYKNDGFDDEQIEDRLSKFDGMADLEKERFISKTVIPELKRRDSEYLNSQKSRFDQEREKGQILHKEAVKSLDDFISSIPAQTKIGGIELSPEILMKAKEQLLNPDHFNRETQRIDPKKAMNNALKQVLFDEAIKREKTDGQKKVREEVMSKLDNTSMPSGMARKPMNGQQSQEEIDAGLDRLMN